MRGLYNIGIRLYGFAIFIASFFNAKAAKWVKGRKGIFARLTDIWAGLAPAQKVAWFHAASLGEFEQGRNVIETFRARNPQYKILLTFFSPSGFEVRKDYNGADYIFYLPLDTPGNAKRFVEIVKPSFVVFIKYEFWFNYLNELKNNAIPVYLISAKFRNDQYFFKSSAVWFRNQLHIYSKIFVQDKESESLLVSNGISNVLVSGDTRFDRVLSISTQIVNYPEIEQFVGTYKLWACGSTWEEDEQLIFPVFERLVKEGKKIKLLIAPHEVSEGRIASILNKFPDAVLYSKSKDAILPDKNVMIIAQIGLLSFLYRYGDIAYIGGGFGKGIHNITEAAVYGVPVIFGANYYKFNEAVELIKRGGAFPVSTENELAQIVSKFLKDEAYLKSCGAIAAQYIREGAGATSKVISVIEKTLN